MRLSISIFVLLAGAAAQDTAVVRGVVHDSQHRPIAGAQVTLKGSATRAVTADTAGEFRLEGLPPGAYTIAASATGFRPFEQAVQVSAARSPVLHVQLEVAPVTSTIEVSSRLDTAPSTVETQVTAAKITETPGAGLTNSLAMVTDFTPGATMVHDMLHIRGGHQVSWFLDGIPVVNTNIAANVAPLINPKNVEELEIERGGFSSQYGDRTYGFFNVVTPSGFERDNEGDLVLSGGNFGSTDDQLSLGGHTERFAWYASLNANRSALGLATPVPDVIHDRAAGVGGMVSLLYDPSAKDQFRWIASARNDYYQVPNSPDAQAAGARDFQRERDELVGMHWEHSFADGLLLEVAPYFHSNGARYQGGPHDSPYVLGDRADSNYGGGRAVLQVQSRRHGARIGTEIWAQHEDTFFGLSANPGAGLFSQTGHPWAASTAVFAEDRYQAASWLNFDLGLRLTRYTGLVTETAATPRLGASIRIPRLGWTLHGYYAYYYQPPPLDSLAGPALEFAASQGFGFVPLRGERDIQHDLGLRIPVAGWSIDLDEFHTSARNFLDHDVVGASGIFIPLADLGAIVHGQEIALRSPRLWRRAQWTAAYSHQTAQGVGPVTGGLLSDAPGGVFPLDHDQRDTLSSVLSLTLPRGAWITAAYQFGSGFLDGDGPGHLPAHSTVDLSIGRHIGERFTVSASAVNIANTRYLLDTSNTFGGTHYANPRQVYGELRYRFHF